MPDSKTRKRKNIQDFTPIVELYQSLTIDQCVELYLQQHENMESWQKKTILSVIGAKTVYKDKYVPNWKLKQQNEQKNN